LIKTGDNFFEFLNGSNDDVLTGAGILSLLSLLITLLAAGIAVFPHDTTSIIL
jgi:hypothetical protein